MPLPKPLAPAVIVNQLALLVAVHPQPACAVTDSAVLPPPGVADTVTGFTVKLHAAPGCVKVTICPATVTVPMRSSAVGLAAAVTLTVPSPVALAPTVTLSHAVLVVATHAQPPGAVTVTSR